ncbi:pseudouridine synthase [Clostridium chauvoei]|uniref:Pseudouridine synthase n=2 Tax=Clostridium chauvoei TaxID=46867 RepID=S6FIS9_9CLOT|nr:pseudouridine synthase [Clostridium chauvoei]ATD55987.1 16S rRNA pseudouridine(516) synthase [Clostridium chauvoei]ATD56344.1 16S rRNA pseudouridine(516) synthase [Clostridium chauvoei]MBX7280885.1 rRNA pseudouridine synthase [Clostridium chauvoei]MBX7283368.1 rRNA pseudouridine synthase [Clostridium chauvoei]MBX7285949.1 rRNA pseudouridine synthase [Clostridium chauvoei]
MERLDKVLSNLGYGTRKEIKQAVRKGFIEVNGIIIKDNGMQVDPEKDKIIVNGEEIFYRKYIYLMMNKPAGVISATHDGRDETVVDLLEIEHQVFNPFPVGRLDKDTVGLLLLTNDGELNHRLISPKWKVDKVYFAEIDKKVTEEDVEKFKNGITLDDGYTCKEAKLEILKATEEGSEILVTIQEGKYHQVKRMFEAVGKEVVYLKRIEFGTLPLDEDLEEGEYRELTEEELSVLKQF